MDVKMKEFDLVSKKSAISESKRQAAQMSWHERLVGELQLKKETFVLQLYNPETQPAAI